MIIRPHSWNKMRFYFAGGNEICACWWRSGTFRGAACQASADKPARDALTLDNLSAPLIYILRRVLTHVLMSACVYHVHVY